MNNKAIQLAGLSPFKQEEDIPEYIDAPFVDGMQAKYDKMYRQQDDRTLDQNTFDVTTEKGMIDYLKHTENSIKAGYDAEKDRWFPHDDGEGNWTIGYGHHIASHMKDTGYTIEGLKKKGLSSEEVEDLLRYDIKRESKLIAENVDGWEDMSTLQKNALLDIQFNIRGNVWTKFKNFTKAIQNKDWINVVMHGSRQEYGNKPNQRNTAFYKSMIEPLMNEWRPQIKNPDYKAPKETEQNNPWWRFGIPDNNAQQLKTEGSLLKLKDPYTGEKMFESPIKSTTVNPISGLSPFKQTDNVDASNEELVQEVRDYFTEYLNSDLFKRRAIELHGQENWESIRDAKLNTLYNTKVVFTSEERFTELTEMLENADKLFQQGVLDMGMARSAMSELKSLQSKFLVNKDNPNGLIRINKAEAEMMAKEKNLSINVVSSIIANEFSHALGAIPKGAIGAMQPYPMTEEERDLTSDKQPNFKYSTTTLPNHDILSYEIKSDIDTTRFELWKAGKYNFEKDFMFNESHMEYIRNNPDKFLRTDPLLEQFDNKGTLNMMNKFTSIDQMNDSTGLDKSAFASLKSKNSSPLMSSSSVSGLSPFKDTEDAVIDYNISLNEAGLSPDPGQDITDLYSEDFLNTFAYFDQQYTDGKLFRRLSGEEITEHDMYIGGTEEYSSYDERIASQQEMFKNNFGSGYSDISQTIERIKERMKNNKVFGTKNDDEIYEFFQFLHKLNEGGIDYKDYTLDDLVVMKDTGRDLRELYRAQRAGDGKGGSHADVGDDKHGTKHQGDHADIILSYEQARSWIKDNNVKSIEDFKELLNKEMSAVYAHELAHASGLGYGVEGVEIIWRNAGDPILSDIDGEKIGEYKRSGYYTNPPAGVDSTLIYDNHYALAKGQMSERDFRIINRLLFRSDSPYGARADYKTRSHDRSVFEVYADMMAFRIAALNEGIYDWRTEDLTREKLLEFIKFYEGEGKQMPFMAKRFIDKMMVAPDSSYREDQSDEEYEKRKYDNLIYMNNVIALGNDSFSDPSNISDPMRINSGTGLDRRV